MHSASIKPLKGRVILDFMMSDDYSKKSGEMLAEESHDNPPSNGIDREAQHTQELVGKLSDLDASIV